MRYKRVASESLHFQRSHATNKQIMLPPLMHFMHGARWLADGFLRWMAEATHSSPFLDFLGGGAGLCVGGGAGLCVGGGEGLCDGGG